MSTRRHAAQVGNLDSLLDTMANVTGILVVLLAVIQLTVGEAMERIGADLSARPELTQDSLDRVEAEALRLAAELAPLEGRRASLESSRSEARRALAAVRSENQAARKAVAAALEFPGDLESLQESLELSERDEQQLERRIGEVRREIAVLDRQLTLAQRSPSEREVVLPDPRPVPPGARQLPVFVRYGRVVPVDVSELIGRLKRGTQRASEGRWIYGEGPPNFVDRSQLVAYFQENDIGTDQFRWHLINNGGRDFYAHLEWRREDMGERVEDLVSGRSQFARTLAKYNPRKAYVYFLAWEDSFEPYLIAREMAVDAGFTAGWTPYEEHAPFRQWLLGGARVSVD